MQLWNVVHAAPLRHVSTIEKKVIKPQYLPHMCSQYGKLRPISGWDRFTSLGHPSKFQRVSRRSTDVNQTLHDVWPSPGPVRYVYVSGGGSCLLTEFCKMQNSLCVQVLRSPILAALLHVLPLVSAFYLSVYSDPVIHTASASSQSNT